MKGIFLAIFAPALLLTGACAMKTKNSYYPPNHYDNIKEAAAICYREYDYIGVKEGNKTKWVKFDSYCADLVDQALGTAAYEKHREVVKNILRTCKDAYIAERLFGRESPTTQERILECVLRVNDYFDNYVYKDDK